MKGKFSSALSLALIVSMLFTSIAFADNVQNDVTVGGNDTFTLGGSTTVNYRINANNGDGEIGCNATVASPAVVTINIPSGVTATPDSLTFTGCGINQSVVFTSSATGNFDITVSVSDSGTGTYNTNPAKFTLHVLAPSDTTAPVITPTIVGTLGDNGWYTSDVTVSWTVVDNESTPTYSCPPTTINADTAGTTVSCSASSAGGTASESVTIKRDATAPGITFVSPSPAIWYNANVTASWSCSDSTSGALSSPVSAMTSGEGASQATTGTCEDYAGNTASDTQYFKVDLTAPSISGSASPAPNSYGWNNVDVAVTFSCGDGLSGVASCGPNQTLSGEGAGQSVTGNAVDNAGNTNSTTVSGINIDKTAPTTTATAAPAANVNGWNNSAVTVSFSGSDGLSGIDSCDDDVVFTTEGAGQVASGTCTDKAGNESDPATATVNIDLTIPLVSLVGGPADGGTYYFGFVPAAPTCDASDALSGLDGSCNVTGYSNAIGTHTVTASATDKAGNSASDSATYTVLAWTLSGFYQPVDMDKVNTVKGGSTVPLKFEIFAGDTELTDPSYVDYLKYGVVACDASTPNDAIETLASGSTSLRYDWTTGQFVYNWKTPKTTGCFSVTVKTDDGSTLVAYFRLK